MTKPVEITVEFYPCARCGTAVKTRWVAEGMLSDHADNVLVGDWVLHPSCWDGMIRENPP